MAAMLPFDADAIAPKNSVREINQLAGKSGRARTCDPRFWRPVLYQLSYTPVRTQHRRLCENSKNRKTTRIIFRNQSQPNESAKYQGLETTLGGMLILRHRSAVAFLHSQDPLQTSQRIGMVVR